MKNSLLILLIVFVSCNTQKEHYRTTIDLQGQWQFALDTANIGAEQKWYNSDLNDTIVLPGTTDSNQKGFYNHDTTTMHLNRLYKYEGAAWYRKKVTIPKNMKNKHLELILERTRSSQIWIDSTFIGSSHLLQSAQKFDVSDYLSPGEHYITIQINNDLRLTPYGNVHIYTDETQTNWNGIIGQICLESSSKTYISNLQVYPDVDNKKIDIELEVENKQNLKDLNIEILVNKTLNGKTTKLKSQKTNSAYKHKIKLSYSFDDTCSLWDEYEQPIYHLTAIISSRKNKDSKTVPFGMRKFETKGTKFLINGHTTFLRGKHDGSVFPLTGYTPTNVEEWIRVYKIAKSYGINHYRFHSYCPPEAAFTAADMEGIYLQVELPFWGGLDSDTIASMLKDEGIAMLKSYANHPSFMMFSLGNEIWGGHDKIEQNLCSFKEYDDRPLYTMGSNNSIGYIEPSKHSEFFVGARTPSDGDTTLTHTRLTHAFADSRDGGLLNTQTPSTTINFDYPVSQIHMPIISHEIGQYQIFPDYREINKYTGVLRAWNLEVFRNRLIKAGMGDMDSAFQKASGAWSALCYKAEMEAALRTKGLGGFQLLDLQDYSGQGTALIGILDAFMDSKNVITPEEWRQSCNDVVLLLEFSKYCWTNNETFTAKAMVANYSFKSFDNLLNWEIKKQDGTILQKGTFDNSEIKNGGLSEAGKLNINLASIKDAEKLTVNISIPNTNYSNTYSIWVYPSRDNVEIPNDIIVSEELNKNILASLQNGAKVLLFPQTESVKQNSVPGLFPPDFWNYGMFKKISKSNNKPVSPGTLGLLIDTKHPIFNSFPTDFHTNWQWFSIIKASNSLILDSIPNDYRPIVQVIDNLERNHKLGLIFEFKVGQGKLLVCMSQLNKIKDKPEALQLYQAIVNYMTSNNFDPKYDLKVEELNKLFSKK